MIILLGNLCMFILFLVKRETSPRPTSALPTCSWQPELAKAKARDLEVIAGLPWASRAQGLHLLASRCKSAGGYIIKRAVGPMECGIPTRDRNHGTESQSAAPRIYYSEDWDPWNRKNRTRIDLSILKKVWNSGLLNCWYRVVMQPKSVFFAFLFLNMNFIEWKCPYKLIIMTGVFLPKEMVDLS